MQAAFLSAELLVGSLPVLCAGVVMQRRSSHSTVFEQYNATSFTHSPSDGETMQIQTHYNSWDPKSCFELRVVG